MVPKESYFDCVIGPGDHASELMKEACFRANEHTYAYQQGMLTEDGGGELFLGDKVIDRTDRLTVSLQTDGVGTKVRIYTRQFEHLFAAKDDGSLSEEEFQTKSVDVWKRMLYDLFAMLVDDFRNGEVAVAITNIIDINRLMGNKGEQFAKSMSQAMSEIIEETQIAIVAGETAVLGNPEQVDRIISENRARIADIRDLLDTPGLDEEVKSRIQAQLDALWLKIQQISEEIDFNIGGAVASVSEGRVLADPEDEHVVIAFQETPKDGIIGPRSNGISLIRDTMNEHIGEDWGQVTFSDLVSRMDDSGKSARLAAIANEYPTIKDKQLWEIATGQSTVFTPFIARELLGGLENAPIYRVSTMTHVTGNPLKKITDGIPNGFSAMVDLHGFPIPPIISICQILGNISDKDAMKSWNMGVPYVITCHPQDAGSIIERAGQCGLIAKRAGVIKKVANGNDGLVLTGVGQENIMVNNNREAT